MSVSFRNAARTWRGETVPPLVVAGRRTRVPVRTLRPRTPLRFEAAAAELFRLRVIGHRAVVPAS
jgi:hypothetical protein